MNPTSAPPEPSSSLGPTRQLNPLTEIDLDPENPRLGLDSKLAQDKLIELMVQKFRIEDVAESILASGWQPFDPIICYTRNHRTVVREGNRRLTALKLLLDPSLAPQSDRPAWASRAARITPELQAQLRKISVVVVEPSNEQAVESYVGFRHVTGVLEWPAEQKAAFIETLIVSHGWSYKQVADRLGSYPKVVERQFVAHRVGAQAREEKIPGHERIKTGILLRSLQTQGARSFLGIEYPNDPKTSMQPVGESNLPNLRDYIAWLFGNEERAAIVKDSRQLTKFGASLQSTESIRYLRGSPTTTLERAWQRSGGQRDTLVESLASAADRLEESVSQTRAFSKDTSDDNVVRRAIIQCADFLSQILRDYPDIQNRFFGEN